MLTNALLAIPSVPSTAMPEQQNYCHDPEAKEYREHLLSQNPISIGLYSPHDGPCQMVDNSTGELDRSINIWEQESLKTAIEHPQERRQHTGVHLP